MRAVVGKRAVYIFLSDNFVIKIEPSKVKVTKTAVFWNSPLADVPIPIPISK